MEGAVNWERVCPGSWLRKHCINQDFRIAVTTVTGTRLRTSISGRQQCLSKQDPSPLHHRRTHLIASSFHENKIRIFLRRGVGSRRTLMLGGDGRGREKSNKTDTGTTQ
ncbi:hypothetical protein J6590_027036 [Homalodisca vitripennis]|nr:hypothetical protein J6590_027036 [Homalodisca vitripennis]